MLQTYGCSPDDTRKIKLLYEHSGIESRYSVLADYSQPAEERLFYRTLHDQEAVPALEKRMELYQRYATPLAIQAITSCLDRHLDQASLTHLITVSCTGMSAPGLDISIMQHMQLSPSLFRTSVNFMGCYAALHALKMADHICRSEDSARVLIVSVELCTLHFQKEFTMDNIAAALLFSDGAAAVLVTGDSFDQKGLRLAGFYSEVDLQGKPDMAWNLSGNGFLMTLSAYVPRLIQSGIENLLLKSLKTLSVEQKDITRWAIHPGGKKILQAVGKELGLCEEDLAASYHVLRSFGNMSSATILFVLKQIMQSLQPGRKEHIFTAAFGPGLTLETAILHT